MSGSEVILSNNDFLTALVKLDLPTVKTNKRITYYNVPAAFDIEVSSFYDGTPIPENKRAVMYIWQFGICDLVTTGRTWDEFKKFIGNLEFILDLSEKIVLPVYVHNLAYEWQFIRKHFNWSEVFLLENRKPVKARTGGIEFRCSLKLSGGKSLAKIGQDLVHHTHKKLVGDLDYEKIRSPITPLTEEELGYCENDIRVLVDYIAEKIEQDGDVTKIPMTNTGYVRNLCRKSCYSRWKKYRSLMDALTITPDEFSQLRRAFMGGHVHANAHYVQQVLQNVGSYDINSSYPAVMLYERFPMSKSHEVEGTLSDEEIAELFSQKACMFRFSVTKCNSKINERTSYFIIKMPSSRGRRFRQRSRGFRKRVKNYLYRAGFYYIWDFL